MNQKTYYLVTGMFFAAVAILHLFRILYGWPAVVSAFTVPMWFSWFAVIFTAYLSYCGLRKK